ncbi:hypothetical protein J7K50_03630 [bacterium]|nr:hypothetical protein [bacterium]
MVLKPAVRIILVTLVIFITACPNQGGGGGENGAIDEAHVSGGVTADDDSGDKLELPRKVTRAMDFPASFTLEEVVEARTGVHIMYTVNPPKTQEIAQMHIADLETRGYTSGDNPSRILEGVDFSGGEFLRIHIKVTEDYERGTVVTIDIEY